MPTAIEMLEHDPILRRHWLMRVVAALIDSALILTPLYLLMLVMGWTQGTPWFMGAVIMGFGWFIYSAIFEYLADATIGKMLVGLRVVPLKGRLQLDQTMLRNLTKVFGGFIAADLIIGMLLETSDPRQRYTDRIAKTSVITHRDILF